ncbi:hypothetical protein C8R31_10896 [Nitrosospira sp. Nsp2]|nr:hypothetical protein C8R31_10896 [Nitrosospira sp. Nsp2]
MNVLAADWKAAVTNFWPVHEPTNFELLFVAGGYSRETHKEARLWAARMHKDPQNGIPSARYFTRRRRALCSIKRVASAVGDGRWRCTPFMNTWLRVERIFGSHIVRNVDMKTCQKRDHLNQVRRVTPSAAGLQGLCENRR